MSTLPWRPRFDYDISSSLSFDLPSRMWRFSDEQVGGGALSATRVGASYVVVRDQLLSVRLRFFEAEWPDVLTLLQYGQAWPNTLTFFPDQDDVSTSYEVQLRHPMMGEAIAPEPDPEFPEVKEIEVVMSKVSGATWADLWFSAT